MSVKYKSLALRIVEDSLQRWFEDPDNKGCEPFIFVRVYKKVKREELLSIKRNRAMEFLRKEYDISIKDDSVDGNLGEPIETPKVVRKHKVKKVSNKISFVRSEKTAITAKQGFIKWSDKIERRIVETKTEDEILIETEFDNVDIKVETIKDDELISKQVDKEYNWGNLSWLASKMRWASNEQLEELKKEYIATLEKEGIDIDKIDEINKYCQLEKIGPVDCPVMSVMTKAPLTSTPVILPSIMHDGFSKKHLVIHRSSGGRVKDVQYVSLEQYNSTYMEFASLMKLKSVGNQLNT